MPATQTTKRPMITLLNKFSVILPDGNVITPTGEQRKLLLLLALRNGACHNEQAIELLWPGEHYQTGRRRLRNVLSRLRKQFGDDLIKRHGETLVLGADIDLDHGLLQVRELIGIASAQLAPDLIFDGLPNALAERKFESLKTHLLALSKAVESEPAPVSEPADA